MSQLTGAQSHRERQIQRAGGGGASAPRSPGPRGGEGRRAALLVPAQPSLADLHVLLGQQRRAPLSCPPQLPPPGGQHAAAPAARGSGALLRPRLSRSGGDGEQIQLFLQSGVSGSSLRRLQAAAGSGAVAMQVSVKRRRVRGSCSGCLLFPFAIAECRACGPAPALGFTAWSLPQIPSGKVQPQPLVRKIWLGFCFFVLIFYFLFKNDQEAALALQAELRELRTKPEAAQCNGPASSPHTAMCWLSLPGAE